MNKLKLLFSLLSIASLFLGQKLIAETNIGVTYIDSLNKALEAASSDTQKIKILNSLSLAIAKSNPDKGLDYAKQAMNLSQKKNWEIGLANAFYANGLNLEVKGKLDEAHKEYKHGLALISKVKNKAGIAKGYTYIGTIYNKKSEYDKALEHYNQSLKIAKSIGDKSLIANNLNMMGVVFQLTQKLPASLDYLLQSLRINDALNDEEAMASNYSNIGATYRHLKEFEKSLEFYNKAVLLNIKYNALKNLSSNYTNIGIIYGIGGQMENCLKYMNMSLEISQQLNDQHAIAINLGNIGNVYARIPDYQKAISFHTKSLNLHKKIGEQKSIANGYSNIASLYYQMAAGDINDELNKQFKGNKSAALKKSELYMDSCISIGRKIGLRNFEDFEHLSDINEQLGNYKEALKNYKEYASIKDSIFNTNNTKKLTETAMQYEFEKKEAIAKAAQDKKDALMAADKKKQAIIRNSFLGGFVLMMALAIVIFNSYKRKKEDNQKIIEQKTIVEIKNKEILSSIEYAKRIQTAILPPIKIVKEYLKNTFILYIPKDIVAGDFYWMENVGNTIYFAACDCTGHGVPGAMVSVVCNNALNRALNEFGLRDPGEIFDKTRELVLENFEMSEEDVKDGMDASLCALNLNELTLQWVGANNPIWIIRNHQNAVEEIKADKQPIGKGYEDKPFTTHNIKLQSGDCIYLFTDGYADQFGESSGKKLTKARFKNLILNIANLPMEEQHSRLLDFHFSFRGIEEQVDDICIIGVRV